MTTNTSSVKYPPTRYPQIRSERRDHVDAFFGGAFLEAAHFAEAVFFVVVDGAVVGDVDAAHEDHALETEAAGKIGDHWEDDAAHAAILVAVSDRGGESAIGGGVEGDAIAPVAILVTLGHGAIQHKVADDFGLFTRSGQDKQPQGQILADAVAQFLRLGIGEFMRAKATGGVLREAGKIASQALSVLLLQGAKEDAFAVAEGSSRGS